MKISSKVFDQLKIVHRCDDFIVCDKPALTLSVPDRLKSDRPCLGMHLQQSLNQQIFPVHRLDYEVSGLIIYALNARAHKDSQAWFQNKLVKKTYRALSLKQNFEHWPAQFKAANEPIELSSYIFGANQTALQKFDWNVKLLRGKKRSYEASHGDLALTHAQFEGFGKTYSELAYWSLNPITGRSHQLRLEMSRHGFPLIGDELYGSTQKVSSFKSVWPFEGIALRAISIEFEQSYFEKIQKTYSIPALISADDAVC